MDNTTSLSKRQTKGDEMPNTTTINSPRTEETPKESIAIGLGNKKIKTARLLNIQHRIAPDTNHHTMAYCARYAIRTPWERPTIIGRNGKVRIVGTQLCRSPLCPLCSNIRSKKEADQLEQIITYLAPQNWNLYFITFTKSTHLGIKKNYDSNREGIKKLNKYARNQKRDHDIDVLRYTILEETYSKEPVKLGIGENAKYITTAHSHVHSLYAFPPVVDHKSRVRFLSGMTRIWKDEMIKAGHKVSKEGVQVKSINNDTMSHSNVSNYLSGIITEKTNLHKELSYSQSKKGKGRSLSQLMIDIDEYGREHDIKAYVDTINTYKGKQRAFKSRNWKPILDKAIKYHEQRKDALALHYVNHLKMDFDLVSIAKAQSATEYSMSENIKYLRINDSTKEYILEFPQDLWDYIAGTSGIIPKLIYSVGRCSLGEKEPISISILKDFIRRRPNYNNPHMKIDTYVDHIVSLIDKEINI